MATDFLVDPIIGKTTFKIDSNQKNNKTLWPSSKYTSFYIEYGSAATLLQLSDGYGKFFLQKAGKSFKIVIPEDGIYQIFIKHSFKTPFGQPIHIEYSINNQPKKTLGWVYYSGFTDLCLFESFKKNDTFELFEPWIYYGYYLSSYSIINGWMVRKIK